MNSDGRPSRGMMAKESGSGVCETSAPRMLKVQATACGSDTTSASAFSFAISGRMVESLVSAASPAKRMSCSVTAPSGGAGRSFHNSSIGFGSIGTSVAPALAQARASFSAPSTVCSHGSKPSMSPLASVRSIHWSGGVSTRCTISNSEVSACSRACKV